MSDNVPRQRLAVDDDVRQFGQLLPKPCCNLLPRPMMVVVQMQDDRVQRQPLLTADRTAAAHVLEAVEQAVEPRPNGVRVLRQRVRAFVRSPERARPAVIVEVLAERLTRSALRTRNDRLRELELIFPRHLMHAPSPPS